MNTFNFNIFAALFAVILFTGCSNTSSEATANEEEESTSATESQAQAPTSGQSTSSNEQQGSMSAPAQPQAAQNVSEEKMKEFVDALMAVQEVQQGEQEKMIKMVEEEGMNPQQYGQISQQMKSGKATDVSAEDKEVFDAINKRMQEMQAASQPMYEAAIEKTDLSIEEYQSIMMAVQQSPELQQKIQQMIAGNQMGAPAGQN